MILHLVLNQQIFFLSKSLDSMDAASYSIVWNVKLLKWINELILNIQPNECSNIISSQFYAAFKDEHPAWALIACAVALAVIAVSGMIMNFGVIVVTFRAK